MSSKLKPVLVTVSKLLAISGICAVQRIKSSKIIIIIINWHLKKHFKKRTVNENRHTGARDDKKPSLWTEEKSLEWTFETVQRHRWMTQLRQQSIPSVRYGCGERSGPICNCLCSRHEKLVVVSRTEPRTYSHSDGKNYALCITVQFYHSPD